MTTPLNQIRMRDPFIIEHQPGQFALFGTTDENLWGGPGTGFDCYTSSDLENWEGPFEAFRPPVGFWSNTQFWAPEVHAYKGAFYMFATFGSVNPKMRGTASLRAENVLGPYLPWSEGPLTPHELPCLDGTFFVDNDGQPWIVYSRGAEGGLADGEMYAAKLSDDLRERVGEPVLLFTSTSAPWSRPLWFPPGVEPPEDLGLAKDPYFTDGAFLFRTPNGSLRMIWSAFGTAGYAIGVAESKSGNVLGPWKQNPTPLWAENGGHGMVLRTQAGHDYLTFHAPNDTPHERAQLVKLDIKDDGVTIVS
ncbi:MAG: glycoside hydrolase family 43 protein [Micrococcales bacterium]